MSNTVCVLLKRTFGLIFHTWSAIDLEVLKPEEQCRKLATDVPEDDIVCECNVSDDLLSSSLMFLKTALGDLAVCYERRENATKQHSEDLKAHQRLLYYTTDGLELDKDFRDVASIAKYSSAKKHFRKCNENCKAICGDKARSLRERIAATKVRVVAEIMGNLENLTVAAGECINIIWLIHECEGMHAWYEKAASPQRLADKIRQRLPTFDVSDEAQIFYSVIDINFAIFLFIKKFLRKPIALIDWPVIKEASQPTTYHPIISEPLIKIANVVHEQRNLFTNFENNGFEIDAQISAVNCKGEIFAKQKHVSAAIVRIAAGMTYGFWALMEDTLKGQKIPEDTKIISLAVDHCECKVPQDQRSADFHQDCKNNLYVLAKYTSSHQLVCWLFVIDVKGKLVKARSDELTFLNRKPSEEIHASIYCSDENVIIVDSTKQQIYVRSSDGELERIIRVTEAPKLSIILDDEEVITLERPNKLHRYQIKDGSSSTPIAMDFRVKAMTFNHLSQEIIVLGNTLFQQEYHLLRYARDGVLQHDIRLLRESKHILRNATLLSHPGGPVVLLNHEKLLYLQ